MVEQTDTDGRGLGWRLFALSFAALFLELMLIRWVPSVVRLVAYYANLMLISSFLGLGAGAIASTKGWRLARWFLPLLVAEVAFVLLCRYVAMPGSGSEVRFYQSHPRLVGYLALVGIFALNTLTFMPLGQQVGELFNRMPTLRAYTWDLGGSLCGTICFAAFSLFAFSPAIGIAIAIGIAAAAGLVRRRVPELAMAAVVVAVVFFAARRDAIWSPYYYILVDHKDSPAGAPPADVRTMTDPPAYNVRVNQDFYQGHFTLDRARYSTGVVPEELAMAEKQYHLPYIARPGAKRVLVLGSGGGVDAEVALLNGAEHVDAVEIDPALVALSRRYNASGVYEDPRVRVHVDDGRAFLQRTAGGYDVIVFGFLDSQGLSSYGNNLRLDGYIYTVESFRRAFNALAPDGWMSLSFAAPREWLARKLVAMVSEATGVRPIVYQAGSQLIVLAPRGGIPDRVPNLPPFELVNLFGPDAPPRATDDWPYLYLQQRAVPSDYVTVIATMLVLSVAGVVALRGRQIGADDAHFFFLGLGFLLLQAKSIGDCSLYFGATWFVTTVVITGVLMMVLAANLLAIRLKRASLAWYVPLLASLLVLTFMPRDTVLGWTYGQRLAWALLVVPLPIFFAGLIFSTTFRNAAVPSAVFGANLIGATVGGFAEYLGMAIGTHALWWIVIAAYGASLLSRLGGGRSHTPAPTLDVAKATA
jgi:hypothetical protein